MAACYLTYGIRHMCWRTNVGMLFWALVALLVGLTFTL